MKKLALHFLWVTLLLTGCAAVTKDVSSIFNNQDTAASSQVQNSLISLCKSETSAGKYTMLDTASGSCNITYIDYTNKQHIFVCAIPNCTHTDDSCTSFVDVPKGEYAPMVLTVNDKLLLVNNTAGSESPAGIEIANSDGSNRTQLVALPAGQTLAGGVYTDGENLLFESWSVEMENAKPVEKSKLCKVSITTGETVQYTPPQGRDVFAIQSFVEGRFIVIDEYDFESKKAVLSTVAIPQGYEATELAFEPLHEYNINNSSAFVSDGLLYEYYFDTNIFTLTNLKTLETKTFDCSPYILDTNGDHSSSISIEDGDYVLFSTVQNQSDGSRRPVDRLIDLNTGEFSPVLSLTLSTKEVEGRTIGINGCYQDDFCIVVDYENVLLTQIGTEGNEVVEVFSPVYALITQENYFYSISDYTTIKGLSGM